MAVVEEFIASPIGLDKRSGEASRPEAASQGC
jgi:hypothetical protein